MPIIQSAKKKMRKDESRTARNKLRKDGIKALTKTMRRTPNAQNLSAVSGALDKAVKVNLIHRNTAARLKSRLSHLIAAK
jgi:ribosomal protein S20